MADTSLDSDIPTPDALAKRHLARTPPWVRKLVTNALSLLAWIGLPSTLLSTLGSLQVAVDAAMWLYRNAGALRPLLRATGEGIVVFVECWRMLTHPLWEALFGWFDLVLPSWAPDALTLLALFTIGLVRRGMTAGFANFVSGSLMLKGQRRTDELQPIPRSFPFKAHFEEYGFMLPPRRLADTQRLWRKWRKRQIEIGLALRAEEWPRFPEETIRAQFGRYWLGVMDGRRAMLIYLSAAVLLVALLLVDWAYRVGVFP